MSRGIREMEKGDFVKTANGDLKEIEKVEGEIPKWWKIHTKDGEVIGMWDACAYYKKEDL